MCVRWNVISQRVQKSPQKVIVGVFIALDLVPKGTKVISLSEGIITIIPSLLVHLHVNQLLAYFDLALATCWFIIDRYIISPII